MARAKILAGAAVMIVSVAAVAPLTPPDTGASTSAQPACETFSASACTAAGGQVAISTTSAPGGSAASAPPPISTASACAALTTIRISTSAPLAASAADAAAWPPSRDSASSASPRMSKPCTRNCFATRLRAMGSPIAPRPTNPTVVMGVSFNESMHAAFFSARSPQHPHPEEPCGFAWRLEGRGTPVGSTMGLRSLFAAQGSRLPRPSRRRLKMNLLLRMRVLSAPTPDRPIPSPRRSWPTRNVQRRTSRGSRAGASRQARPPSTRPSDKCRRPRTR